MSDSMRLWEIVTDIAGLKPPMPADDRLAELVAEGRRIVHEIGYPAMFLGTDIDSVAGIGIGIGEPVARQAEADRIRELFGLQTRHAEMGAHGALAEALRRHYPELMDWEGS